MFLSIPDYKFLKVFGCCCFPNPRLYNKNKVSPCICLGYRLKHKGYKCLTSNNNIVISLDVIFYENIFSFFFKLNLTSPSLLPTSCASCSIIVFYTSCQTSNAQISLNSSSHVEHSSYSMSSNSESEHNTILPMINTEIIMADVFEFG